MRRLHTASFGIGLVGFVVGLAVSALGGTRDEPGNVAAGDVRSTRDGTYAFGFALGSNLWSVTMRRTTPALPST